jgi:hypothetical protein
MLSSSFLDESISVLNDPDYDISLSSFHKTKDDIVKNMLCVPVFDLNGSTIAVIQAINKVEQGVAKKNRGLRRSTISKGVTNDNCSVFCDLYLFHVIINNYSLKSFLSAKRFHTH